MSRGTGRGNYNYNNNLQGYGRGGGGRGGYNNSRGGVGNENTWMNDLPIGPRNDCLTCGAIMEEKHPNNGKGPYWVCGNCRIAGRPNLNPAPQYQQQQPQYAQPPLQPVVAQQPPPPPPPPTTEEHYSLTDVLLEDINEKATIIIAQLKQIARMGDLVIASQKFNKRQFQEMVAASEEEAEEPETQPPSSPILGEEKKTEVISNDLRKKFMLKKQKV